MIVQEATGAARRWAMAEAEAIPGFEGAYFHGSIVGRQPDAPFPASSDVDVMVVLAGPEPPEKPGKFIYDGVLLEVSYLPGEQVRSPEYVLGQYHLAGSFRTASVILDPSGRLTDLQAAVARDFAKPEWVRRRCENARDKVLCGYTLRACDSFDDQVVSWLFPAGVTTHVLLVAGLRNPTVRQRYVAVRDLLVEYGSPEFHEFLLELLGCARMSHERAEHHLAALTEVFDVAKTVVKTPFFFASDISDIARPIAIDGSLELIARGDHREAVFWMVATYARCQKVLAHDAPVSVQRRFEPGFRELLADLGIASFADLAQRKAQVVQALPQVWELAEAIMAANPGIERG